MKNQNQKIREWKLDVISQNHLFCFMVSVFCVMYFTACQQETTSHQPTAAAKQELQKQETVSPVTTINQDDAKEEKAVEVKATKNPFKSFISKFADKPKVVSPRTPLQKFELEQLKLVAVLWGINGSFAMVEAPDGKGYSIKKGDLIGNKDGKVKRIENDKIIVEERLTDVGGEVITNDYEIRLPLPKGEEELK